jgi:hypothetical protein
LCGWDVQQLCALFKDGFEKPIFVLPCQLLGVFRQLAMAFGIAGVAELNQRFGLSLEIIT